MRCPRCDGDMSSGVCEDCGFPVTMKTGRKSGKYPVIKYNKQN